MNKNDLFGKKIFVIYQVKCVSCVFLAKKYENINKKLFSNIYETHRCRN